MVNSRFVRRMGRVERFLIDVAERIDLFMESRMDAYCENTGSLVYHYSWWERQLRSFMWLCHDLAEGISSRAWDKHDRQYELCSGCEAAEANGVTTKCKGAC
jgi:hypothetical protein